MSTTGTPRRADIDSFFTCRHAERFAIDWRSFYTRAQERTDDVRHRWAHELDIAYGPHASQRLDLYVPDAAVSNGLRGTRSVRGLAPVLLFLHGGGFREGDPTLYGYLARPYLERGIVFASVGYRLTPEAFLPETARDLELALSWCFANLAARGGDPNAIFVSGHSAGAILTAHVALRSDWQAAHGLPADLIKGAIPISGVYDFSDEQQRGEMFASSIDRGQSSPLMNIATFPPATLIAYGSRENQPNYGIDSRRLADAISARGGRAELLELDGLDHKDTADALADEASPLFQKVAALLGQRSAAGR